MLLTVIRITARTWEPTPRLALNGVRLHEDEFEGIAIAGSFEGSYLDGARFHRTDMKEVVFDSAEMRGASFRGADTDLSGADLSGARLIGAQLRTARLTGAKLDGVVHNSETVWPDGFIPPPL